MAKSAELKAIEKQNKQQQRLARQESRRMTANAIVMGQPMVGGIRIMDDSSEELLQLLINEYNGNENENNYVRISYDALPDRIEDSLGLELEKLSMYGMISTPYAGVGYCEMYLTPQAINYFERRYSIGREEIKRSYGRSFKQYDVFLSHATKDKNNYVDELNKTFKKLGINVFYDSDSITWGDNWKESILNGTASSEFAVIVISKNFFGREWAEKELHEFLKRQNEDGQKIVLPLIHGITVDELREMYPDIADIQVIDTRKKSKEEIVIYFARELIKRLRGYT